MSKKYSELRFEEWIETSLLNNGYHRSFIHSNELSHLYDRELCLIGEEVLVFIKSTQKEEYDKLYSSMDELTDSHILKKINGVFTENPRRDVIYLLRNGIDTKGCHFNLVYFQPKSTLNETHLQLYSHNRFTVVRQLHYSKNNNNSIDMVIFLNGIPIITLELKNQMSGQNITNSENQYRSRDEREPIFTFKRVLVHFCVDNDKVSMSTQLRGSKTKFLPYNKGITNPNLMGDYRVEYLWNDVLLPTSVLDIIENFVLISKEVDREWNDKKKMVIENPFDILIFPRYHQLEVIRRLKSKIKEEGVGNNYLIQHTTGSGKSYSIGWLSHLLVSLYQKDGDTKRMFDTIIVVTDRKVLDRQLQKTVGDIGQTVGVVNPVDLNSEQLKKYLELGKDIIITTVQKFGVISKTISKLKTKSFAVVIDEVHSSQSGETQKHLKKSLSKGVLNEEELDEDEEEKNYEDIIEEEIRSRGKQKHISFFGFTGTPKNKTLELFGRKNEVGEFVPFHSYTMKQSIYEGFTLDVLKNYTTYKRYFKVLQSGEDKELPEGKVKKELVNFVDSHSETIRQKVSIILEHFVSKTSKTIDGKGRGMVVVRSRKHCVLFHEEMVKQMKEMGLSYSCLVGYSGTIFHNGRENTETSLNSENGMVGNDIPNGLKDPRFRILIVSNKFQTGFDEPLLQSMYVDKKLGGVQCVQTLSRLNRTTKGKTDTFVLDFVNETEDIVESFQTFFTSTVLSEETDPDKLYSMIYGIEEYNLYTKYQLDEFCKEFYSQSQFDKDDQYILNEVLERFNERLNEVEREEFKSKIQSFLRMYSYITQISNFGLVHWEKTFVFLTYLNKKLPKRESGVIDILDSIDLDSFRIQKIGESKLELEDIKGELDPISSDSGGKNTGKDEKELLSEIIEKINDIFGKDLKDDDKVTFKIFEDKLISNDELTKVLMGDNSDDVKFDYFQRKVKDNVIDIYSDKFELYKMIMNEKIFPQLVHHYFRTVTEHHRKNP
jgi:type I restriction enzyme, R subunit